MTATRTPGQLVAEFHHAFGLPVANTPTNQIRGELADLRRGGFRRDRVGAGR